MKIFIIFLGCNILNILMDRINIFSNFIKNNYLNNISNNEITLFLSGGIKNLDLLKESEIKTEADIINYHIKKIIDNNKNPNLNWNIIMDKKSINTVENFMEASKFINISNINYNLYYIVTSNFHYERAKLILDIIDNSKNYEWILGNLELEYSRYWENIHIKNIFSDIEKTKNIITNH